MKVLFIVFGLILNSLLFCKSNDNRENLEKIREEKIHSNVKFLAECFGTNPTLEELFFYYEIKRRDYITQLQNHKDDSPIDISQIRRNMIANNQGNPFMKYDFLNPWKEPPPISRPARNSFRSFWSYPNYNYNGYRHSAPINVKPGHLF